MKENLPFQFVLPFTFTFFFNGLFSSDNHHKGINIIKALPQYNQDSNLYIQISKTLKMSKCFPLQLIYAIHFHFLFQLIFFQLHHSKTRATHWKTPMFVVLKSFQVWPDDSSIGSGEGRGSANIVLSILKRGGKGGNWQFCDKPLQVLRQREGHLRFAKTSQASLPIENSKWIILKTFQDWPGDSPSFEAKWRITSSQTSLAKFLCLLSKYGKVPLEYIPSNVPSISAKHLTFDISERKLFSFRSQQNGKHPCQRVFKGIAGNYIQDKCQR